MSTAESVRPPQDGTDDEPVRVYGAELDDATCATCAGHAGLEYAPDDPDAPKIPNPACTCTHGCRCEWL